MLVFLAMLSSKVQLLRVNVTLYGPTTIAPPLEVEVSALSTHPLMNVKLLMTKLTPLTVN